MIRWRCVVVGVVLGRCVVVGVFKRRCVVVGVVIVVVIVIVRNCGKWSGVMLLMHSWNGNSS